MNHYTVEEFQNNFDEFMTRVENGENFVIKGDHGDVIITADFVEMHQSHDDAC